MSGNRQNDSSGNTEDFGKMNSEDIEKLIGSVFVEEDIDVELLDDLLEIYDKFDDVPAVDVDAALERFKSDHMGQDEIYISVDADNTTQTKRDKKSKHPHRQKSALRYGYIAATLIVLITILLYVTPAGASVKIAIGNWTSETFGFGSQRFSSQIDPELESLHEALADNGITDRLAPIWLPEGFALFDLSEIPTPNQTLIVALYKDNRRELTIQIIKQSDFSIHSYEKDENEIELYPRNGIDHYIMANNGKTNAVWSTGNYECVISGDISADEVKQMIDSIYER